MNNRQVIAKLYDISEILDQQEQYRYSDEIQNLATRLAILNLPPQRLDHPGTYDLKRNYLEPLPPQNLLETLYQDFAGYGKPLPKVKLPFFPETKIDWTPDKFFADVIRDYEGTGHINNDFQDLLIDSPKFVNLLHDYIFNKKEGNTRLKDQFKEMIEKGEFALTYRLRREFKKLKSVYRDTNKTNIRRVLPALLKISEILPTEFRSEVQAMNEWLEQQWTNETEIYDAERAYEPRFQDKLNAHEELKDYLTPTDEEIENLQKTSVAKNIKKKQIIASLIKIANNLDENGLFEIADQITNQIKIAALPDTKNTTNQLDNTAEWAGEDKLKEWNEKFQPGMVEDQRDVMHDIKATWNQKANREFLNSLTYIHYGQASKLDPRMNLSNVEMSCIAYKKPPFKNRWVGNAGIMLKGHVTLAANHDLQTNQYVFAPRQRQMRWTDRLPLIVDEKDFAEDEFNEFVLVNWKPIAIVKSYPNESATKFDQIMSAEDLAAKYNLPLLDENGNQIN